MQKEVEETLEDGIINENDMASNTDMHADNNHRARY